MKVALLAACVLAVSIVTVNAGNYNYGDVISKSLLFYQAQRCGKLPASNPIRYRVDSFLNDKDGNIDLTGGYFDAGDYVKFNFPAAYAMTNLAWGGIDFAAGYAKAGQTRNLLDAVRWGTDYLMKCHPSPNVLYVQVGDGNADHASWDLPQRWSGPRPAYKLDSSKPGSDAAGETAAAFASASILFKSSDPNYSRRLLDHARTTYNFAKTFQGKYSDSVPAATPFYTSDGYLDELAWAAAWLHRATGETGYLNDAKAFYAQDNLQWKKWYGWNLKAAGVSVLLTKATNGEAIYKNALESYCDWAVWGTKRTPRGLSFFTEWGSNRAASDASFICLMASQLHIKENDYKNYAKSQIDYMLGDSGRSYVVGFGNNPPTRPHHRASSCPNPPASCGWSFFNDASKNNANQLVGALVGGPGPNDDYIDTRDDSVKNEVALDYNAGFQGALAGLLTDF